MANKSSYSEWGAAKVQNFMEKALADREAAIAEEIALGRPSFVEFDTNEKLNGIITVGLLPGVDCPKCSGVCLPGCYALRHLAGRSDGKRKKYARNSARLANNREAFFSDVKNRARLAVVFRWFESGDIKDYDFFVRMLAVAEAVPTCQFYAYTKNYEVVEEAYRNGLTIPANFNLILSAWNNLAHVLLHNPYKLAVSMPDFSEAPAKYQKPFDPQGLRVMDCNGDCAKCFVDKTGCAFAKFGELVRFRAH